MQIALAYHKGDQDQATRWASWVAELGGVTRHQLFIMPSRGADPIDPQATAWNRVEFVVDSYGIVSNWNADDPIRDASGPNSMFRQLAWFFLDRARGPWMFCEPDAIPLRSTWLDELEAEYIRMQKPYMGAVIPGKDKEYATHATGNGIYPQDAAHNEGLMIPQFAKWGDRTIEIAFDVASAKSVLVQFASTQLMQQIFRGEPFRTQADLARIRPEAAVFHNDKTGGLVQLLREKKEGRVGPQVGNIGARPDLEHYFAAPETTVEAPIPNKPTVHTYCAWSSDPTTSAEQAKVLLIWEKNWADAGWQTRVLTERTAMDHPKYEEFRKGFAALPIKNPMEYEMACFMRWVAMANMGGLMVDYDVLTNGFMETCNTITPVKYHAKIQLYCGHVPCVVSGSPAQYEAAAADFISNKSKSDMHFFEGHKDAFEQSVFRCLEYGKEDWTNADLIHFAHFACGKFKRSEVMQDWMHRTITKNLVPQLAKSIAIVYSVQDAVAALVEHSKKDPFSKARICHELAKAGFIKPKLKAMKK